MSGRVCIVAPDRSLADMAAKVAGRYGGEVEVLCGSLSEGLRLARGAVERGAGIIISRGGTGDLIERNLDVPVVYLETSGYDVIRSVSRAVTASHNIGIVGFHYLIRSYEKAISLIESTFDASIVTMDIDGVSDIGAVLGDLRESGVEVVIGGTTVVTECGRLGIPSVLIETIEETLVDTIAQARNYLELRLKEKQQVELLNSIIDFAYDGILAIDREGLITVFNPVIQSLTGRTAKEAMGQPVDEIVENTRMSQVIRSGAAELGDIQRIGTKTIVTNRIPIRVDGEVLGVVATFQEVESLQKMEANVRRKLQSKGHTARFTFEDIRGRSPALISTIEKARLFARTDSTVLILGESGTGKELFAQSIHNESVRSHEPFVAVNCAALPENLLESELFGYVEGAFTGAKRGGKVGLFELAHHGTVFLDEISEMNPNLQARLLRVLQEREVTRLGADYVIPLDVRVIAASNRDLYRFVNDGMFREDLYYRLCVLALTIPPLRERREDISDIVSFFAEKKSRDLGLEACRVSDEAMEMFLVYEWPGNVRQLENVIERCVVLGRGGEIGRGIVKDALDVRGNEPAPVRAPGPENGDIGDLRRLETGAILRVLEEAGGNRKLAAERLGISTTTLWRRLKSIEKS